MKTLLFLVGFFAVSSGLAVETIARSITFAQNMRMSGGLQIQTGQARAQFVARKLDRAEDERIANEIAGRGVRKISNAAISSDGSIFVVGQKGQGSQAELLLLIFKEGNWNVIPVTQINENTIFFSGGRLEIQSGQR